MGGDKQSQIISADLKGHNLYNLQEMLSTMVSIRSRCERISFAAA